MSPVQPSLFLSKYNHSVSINESFYDKKIGATQTDPDLALRRIRKAYCKVSLLLLRGLSGIGRTTLCCHCISTHLVCLGKHRKKRGANSTHQAFVERNNKRRWLLDKRTVTQLGGTLQRLSRQRTGHGQMFVVEKASRLGSLAALSHNKI